MTDKIFNFLVNYFSNINDRGVDEMNNFRGDITSDEIVEWLQKVQNIHVKQLSERLGDEIDHFRCSDEFALAKRAGEEVTATAQHFAEWQKRQDKAVIERAEDHAKLAGMALGEKEAINKAYKWLEDNV